METSNTSTFSNEENIGDRADRYHQMSRGPALAEYFCREKSQKSMRDVRGSPVRKLRALLYSSQVPQQWLPCQRGSFAELCTFLLRTATAVPGMYGIIVGHIEPMIVRRPFFLFGYLFRSNLRVSVVELYSSVYRALYMVPVSCPLQYSRAAVPLPDPQCSRRGSKVWSRREHQ